MGGLHVFCLLSTVFILSSSTARALPPASTISTDILGSTSFKEPNCAEVLSTNPIDLNLLGPSVAAWVRSIHSQTSKPFLSIVIPAYREEARLPHSIRRIKSFLDQHDIPTEVLIIVEKSPDQTLTVGQNEVGFDPRIQVVDNVVQRGKGYAVRSGMLRAQGEIIFFMDADLSTPLHEILSFLDHFRQNPEVDVLIGDRRRSTAQEEHTRSFLRKTLSSGFNSLVHWLSPLDFEDTQAGFKAFRRNASRAIFDLQRNDRFAFDVEVLLLAQELGLRVDSLDIEWHDDARSTVNPWIDSPKMLKDMFQIRRDIRRRLSDSQRANVR